MRILFPIKKDREDFDLEIEYEDGRTVVSEMTPEKTEGLYRKIGNIRQQHVKELIDERRRMDFARGIRKSFPVGAWRRVAAGLRTNKRLARARKKRDNKR